MALTKQQMAKYKTFCKKHKIVCFGGMYCGAPCISLDIFAGKNVWITERSIPGHYVGVHKSVEGDTEVCSVWAGAGWCMFGKRFIEALTAEFRQLFPENSAKFFTEGYDKIEYKANYIRVFATRAEAVKAGEQ